MARIRTIKPEFFTSLTVAGLTPEQRLTFIGLWTYVDDAGRAIDDARLVKAAVWPLDDRTSAEVEADLWALTESSLILRYTLSERSFLAVRNWSEHQRINRPTASTLPGPENGTPRTPPPRLTCMNEDSLSTHGVVSEPSPLERKGRERKGKENNSSSVTALAPRNPPRADVEEACRLLADLIEANGSKRPTITGRWRDAARLMIDNDERTLDDVLGAIRWSQNDNFWRANILSMPKLREKYDQLRLIAQQSHRTLAATGTDHYRPSTADRRVADAFALAEELRREETQP